MGSLLISVLPYEFIAGFYAWIIYLVARRRGVNPIPWILGTFIPVIGFIVAGVFFVLTLLSILDRLSALEQDRTFR
jgi:hypothetical protein